MTKIQITNKTYPHRIYKHKWVLIVVRKTSHYRKIHSNFSCTQRSKTKFKKDKGKNLFYVTKLRTGIDVIH